MPPNPRTCPVCWTPFTPTRPGSRQIYCSKKCCGTAWERRGSRQTRPATPTSTPTPQPAPQPAAIRGCPHCGQPITIVALLTTPEAARPATPQAAPDTVIPIRRT
jgi:hypothetical protein